MTNIKPTPIRKIIGLILIVLGFIGAFLPIPLVPFFVLAIIGFGFIGIEPEFIKKIKKRRNKNKNNE